MSSIIFEIQSDPKAVSESKEEVKGLDFEGEKEFTIKRGDITKECDPLKDTKYDKVFGPNSPIRCGEIFGSLKEHIKRRPILGTYLRMVDTGKYSPVFKSKKFTAMIHVFFLILIYEGKKKRKLFDLSKLRRSDLRKYRKIEKWYKFEREFDVPHLAKKLFTSRYKLSSICEEKYTDEIIRTITFYLIETKNEKALTKEMEKTLSMKFGLSHEGVHYLAYMRKKGYDMSCHRRYRFYSVCEIVAFEKKWKFFKKLRNPSLPGGPFKWSTKCTYYAAEQGNVKMMKWLRNPNTGGGVCDWTKWSCVAAVRNSDYDMMDVLRNPDLKEMCPWNEECTDAAIKEDDEKMFRSLRNPDVWGGRCPSNTGDDFIVEYDCSDCSDCRDCRYLGVGRLCSIHEERDLEWNSDYNDELDLYID